MAIKYVTKESLLELNRRAIQNEKNRTLDDGFFDTLPDGGVRYPVMFHMTHNGEDFRVIIGVVTIGFKSCPDRISMVALDMDFADFNGLPCVE